MNKREREEMYRLIVEWEWNTLPGMNEAGAVARCGRRLQQVFAIPDNELAFARAWEIFCRMREQTGDDYSDEFFDVLMDMVEEDLESVVDQIESMEWNEFASYIASLEEKDD